MLQKRTHKSMPTKHVNKPGSTNFQLKGFLISISTKLTSKSGSFFARSGWARLLKRFLSLSIHNNIETELIATMSITVNGKSVRSNQSYDWFCKWLTQRWHLHSANIGLDYKSSKSTKHYLLLDYIYYLSSVSPVQCIFKIFASGVAAMHVCWLIPLNCFCASANTIRVW